MTQGILLVTVNNKFYEKKFVCHLSWTRFTCPKAANYPRMDKLSSTILNTQFILLGGVKGRVDYKDTLWFRTQLTGTPAPQTLLQIRFILPNYFRLWLKTSQVVLFFFSLLEPPTPTKKCSPNYMNFRKHII